MKTASSRLSRFAFTLIELLVVISIIAILASLTFSGVQTALLSAKKVQARNDMSQIAIGVTSYYTEYGRYPIDSATVTTDDKAVYGNGTDNSAIINVLRCVTSGTTLNPRQIQFLQPKVLTTGSAVKGCVGSTGNWYDPWGAQYIIFIDADYAGDINATAVGSGTVQIGVGVASVGYYFVKNNLAPGGALPSTYDKTYLLSWQ
ncbi:MAG: prepilin-type N-terminal cleavage/methylation domain-containing protein [Verrucomicrobiota bacterium]